MTKVSHIIASTKNLSIHFDFSTPFRKKVLKAVNDISIDVYRGEVLAIVGESGSGKSTLGRALLRLNKPESGDIYFEEENITSYNRKQMQPLRKQVQMIFQDPNSSLNPKLKLFESIKEPLVVNKIGSKQEQHEQILSMLNKVQLPQDFLHKYPHQLSGGQKQRVAIARALISNPKLIVADEPVSALDVSVQAQIINLLSDLKEELGLTIVIISHDLSLVQYLADRVAVMYLGNIVEIGQVEDVFSHPQHPYTQALIEAMPEPNLMSNKTEQPIIGDIPSPFDIPSGCAFRSRCQVATSACASHTPILKQVSLDHQVACINVK